MLNGAAAGGAEAPPTYVCVVVRVSTVREPGGAIAPSALANGTSELEPLGPPPRGSMAVRVEHEGGAQLDSGRSAGWRRGRGGNSESATEERVTSDPRDGGSQSGV